MTNLRRLGLIGGLGPDATIHYYRELCKLGAGEFLLINADLERVLSGIEQKDRSGLADYFAGLIQRLSAAGAEIAAISAVAPHICIGELRDRSALPLIDILKEVASEIQDRGYKTVALLGAKQVVESGLYGALKEICNVHPVDADAVHHAYLQIVRGDAEGKTLVERIVSTLAVDAVVLAGTDLSPAFAESHIPFPKVDAAGVHLRAIVRVLTSENFVESFHES